MILFNGPDQDLERTIFSRPLRGSAYTAGQVNKERKKANKEQQDMEAAYEQWLQIYKLVKLSQRATFLVGALFDNYRPRLISL